MADPPWRYDNSSGKASPEHRRLHRYQTMEHNAICQLINYMPDTGVEHLYLWTPVPLIWAGLDVMRQWGFQYKTIVIWEKVRKDGKPDGRCCGFYFRTCTEFLLFGVRKNKRTKRPWNRPNIITAQKREHSRKPDETYELIEASSEGPYLELFARHPRPGWTQWGDQLMKAS